MLFVTHHLARRLELAEAEFGVGCVKAQKLLEPSSDAAWEPFLGGYLLYVGIGSPFTHVMGLGFEGPVAASDVDRMEEFYRSRGAGITVDVSPYADGSLLEHLSQRHYRISEFTTVLVRTLSPNESIPVEAAVRLVSQDEAGLYAETVVRGFFGRDDLTAEERNLGRVLFHMPDTSAYFAVLDGVAAGCGQMAVHHGVASCFSDSTLLEFRRRGAHAATIRARVADALARGCDLITAGTQPGSVSQRDYERQGFQVAFTKVTMVLD